MDQKLDKLKDEHQTVRENLVRFLKAKDYVGARAYALEETGES